MKPYKEFNTLLERKSDLAHAYSKYKNSASVLPFNVIYTRVVNFLEPFINNASTMRYWNGNTWN